MIRILHVLGTLDRGGAETMLMNIYRHIDKNKIQFDFVIHTQKKGEYEQEILENGGKIYRMPRYNIRNHKEYISKWRDFFNTHKEYKIIHGHQRGTAFIYLKIAKEFGIKTIMHSHSISSRGEGIERIVKDFLRYPMRKYVDYPFACSVVAGKWLFGNNILENKKFKIIKNGIEIKKYIFNAEIRNKIRQKLKLNRNIVIGHVGSFTEPKNHKFLIDIFGKFQKYNKNAVLLLLGEGPLKNNILSQLQELGLTENVRLIGNVENVNEYLQAMDIFIFPSKYEGFGMAVIEAQTSGLSCIVSDILPVETKICDDLIHYLSLKTSKNKWIETMKNNLNYHRTDRSNEVIKSGYSSEVVANDLEKIYFNILNKEIVK